MDKRVDLNVTLNRRAQVFSSSLTVDRSVINVLVLLMLLRAIPAGRKWPSRDICQMPHQERNSIFWVTLELSNRLVTSV